MSSLKFRVWHKENKKLYSVMTLQFDEFGKINAVDLYDYNNQSFQELDSNKIELRVLQHGKNDTAENYHAIT